jgi:4-hydroxythreonine-4-phosphate dehydrogenase
MKPTIALVQGDPTGIGPELMAKLLALDDVRDAANIAIFSDRRVFEAGCRTAGISHDVPVIEDFEEADFSADPVWLIDLPAIDPDTLTPGRLSRDAGAAVLTWFGAALDLCAAGVLDGLCFMPFNKDAMHQAGLDTEDETQWARKHIGHDGRVSEFNVIDGMWNARVTSHVPHREVAGLLSVDEIVASIELADRTLSRRGAQPAWWRRRQYRARGDRHHCARGREGARPADRGRGAVPVRHPLYQGARRPV